MIKLITILSLIFFNGFQPLDSVTNIFDINIKSIFGYYACT